MTAQKAGDDKMLTYGKYMFFCIDLTLVKIIYDNFFHKFVDLKEFHHECKVVLR